MRHFNLACVSPIYMRYIKYRRQKFTVFSSFFPLPLFVIAVFSESRMRCNDIRSYITSSTKVVVSYIFFVS